MPSIIQHLLSLFSDNPLKAREILPDHKRSNEALEIKQLSAPIIEFCRCFQTTADANGLFVGNENSKNWKNTLYSAYLTFWGTNNLAYKVILLFLLKRCSKG